MPPKSTARDALSSPGPRTGDAPFTAAGSALVDADTAMCDRMPGVSPVIDASGCVPGA
ncbi:hypothetical protein M2271_006080 [Streptomyces sp. LBL]|uniref:hypothetical protein n=1 Tax=Streptomyces sp. LBL TaxID=2940562 RepID=UPI002476E276|nr:hypothetical protein [Streptomyces sp. LBL]MDH6628248.1 hypothetical protein [Streptomyces sp. LBL]